MSSTSKIVGRNMKPVGLAPAVALVNPKYPRNVGQAMRACSCFGISQLWFSGNRVSLDPSQGRLPREERMKGYKDVELIQYDYFFDMFDKSVTPVAIEVRPNSEVMSNFEHPENPLYVFGPEDGSIPDVVARHCHRFVIIPIRHCSNLSAAVYMTLYDRQLKRHWAGLDPIPLPQDCMHEDRGYEIEHAEVTIQRH